ncbi:MAG: DUF1648 domain-containing protein [Thaumarchaeota archaeon]|nr:DUF1648 domain-containing protein [Candidatus Calditenuaceae archaeon]MDW8041807.1 DUF1648 domain-containing protein [Nitrososphaerota archaeon]
MASLIASAAVAAYALLSYESLPERVAIDFDFAGRPTRYAPKSELLSMLVLLVAILSSVTIFTSVLSIKRHTIVERYPYLVNLPALAILIGKLSPQLRKTYIDRAFIPLPASILMLNLVFFLPLVHIIIEAARTEFFPSMPFITLSLTIVFLIVLFTMLYYRRIYKELRSQVT